MPEDGQGLHVRAILRYLGARDGGDDSMCPRRRSGRHWTHHRRSSYLHVPVRSQVVAFVLLLAMQPRIHETLQRLQEA